LRQLCCLKQVVTIGIYTDRSWLFDEAELHQTSGSQGKSQTYLALSGLVV
jgi:hypothetical protein